MQLMTAVPDFELAATDGLKFQLSAMKGSPLVLYFYPKDDTPGCTDEGLQFKNLYDEFKQLKCSVLGISRDSVSSHERFKKKFEFPFPLLSDPDEVACAIFDVIKMKNMYGKQVRGIQRSTFVIDKNGILRQEWRGVSVPGHAQNVLEFIKTL